MEVGASEWLGCPCVLVRVGAHRLRDPGYCRSRLGGLVPHFGSLPRVPIVGGDGLHQCSASQKARGADTPPADPSTSLSIHIAKHRPDCNPHRRCHKTPGSLEGRYPPPWPATSHRLPQPTQGRLSGWNQCPFLTRPLPHPRGPVTTRIAAPRTARWHTPSAPAHNPTTNQTLRAAMPACMGAPPMPRMPQQSPRGHIHHQHCQPLRRKVSTTSGPPTLGRYSRTQTLNTSTQVQPNFVSVARPLP